MASSFTRVEIKSPGICPVCGYTSSLAAQAGILIICEPCRRIDGPYLKIPLLGDK